MTTTMGQDQIVKIDRIGRVKTPRERREALLAEFDRSGMSGQSFAKWAGIKHPTLTGTDTAYPPPPLSPWLG